MQGGQSGEGPRVPQSLKDKKAKMLAKLNIMAQWLVDGGVSADSLKWKATDQKVKTSNGRIRAGSYKVSLIAAYMAVKRDAWMQYVLANGSELAKQGYIARIKGKKATPAELKAAAAKRKAEKHIKAANDAQAAQAARGGGKFTPREFAAVYYNEVAAIYNGGGEVTFTSKEGNREQVTGPGIKRWLGALQAVKATHPSEIMSDADAKMVAKNKRKNGNWFGSYKPFADDGSLRPCPSGTSLVERYDGKAGCAPADGRVAKWASALAEARRRAGLQQ